jgi:hypothetical protein
VKLYVISHLSAKYFRQNTKTKIFDSTPPTGSFFCYVHYHLPKSVRNASFL